MCGRCAVHGLLGFWAFEAATGRGERAHPSRAMRMMPGETGERVHACGDGDAKGCVLEPSWGCCVVFC